MLDGLLGRSGFSSKCKSLIKPTRTRIEVLRRRAEAKQRFLKEDLAKLLANGLDVNAYGRTEDFIAGLNMLSCYNFIDQSCEYILKQLSVMQKLGQCPEECRETVASLMFAAARFSDLPELRDLRDVFQDRYGNGLECYVNQVFVEKLASKPPVVEKRIKLLQDIAVEFSIQWDSKGFKERMDKPSILAQPLSVSDDSKYKVQNGNNVFRKTDRTHEGPKLHNDHKCKVPNGNSIPNKNDQRSKERLEQKYDGPPSYDNGKIGTHGGPKLHNDDKYKVPKGNVISNKNDQRSKEKLEQSYDRPPSYDNHEGPNLHIDDKYKVPNGNISSDKNNHRSKERLEQSYDRPPLYDNGTNINVRRQEVSNIPFVARERHVSKPETIDTRDNNNNNDHLFSKTPRSSRDRRPDYLYNEKPEDVEKSTEKEKEPIRLLKPPYVKSNIPPPYTKPNNHHRQPSPENPNSDRREKEKEQEDRHYYQNDIPLPKPRSVRRKHSKSSSSHDDVGSSEDSRIVKRISSSRRKERKGLQILFDDEHYHRKDDEEEKMMDKLLLHYSKKPSSYDGKLKKKKSRSSNKSPRHEVNGNDEVETSVQPIRSISLPHETEQPKKVYARANSFQPDNQAPHVHPKLPDYDDLAARFAALRGR